MRDIFCTLFRSRWRPDRRDFYELMSKDIIVVKYYETFTFKVPGIPDFWPRWGVAYIGRDRIKSKYDKRVHLKPITKKKAMTLIKDNGLVETHRDHDGVIYDTPNQDFKRKGQNVNIPLRLGAEI